MSVKLLAGLGGPCALPAKHARTRPLHNSQLRLKLTSPLLQPLQALGAKLDAERHLPAAQQAVAAAPGAHLSPGSRRLLERRRQRELALEMEAAGCMRAGMEGCDAGGDHNTHSSPLGRSGAFGHTGLEGTGASQLASKAGAAGAPALAAFPYRPAITARAAAKPARTPEELHDEAAHRQEKLVRLAAWLGGTARACMATTAACKGGHPTSCMAVLTGFARCILLAPELNHALHCQASF